MMELPDKVFISDDHDRFVNIGEHTAFDKEHIPIGMVGEYRLVRILKVTEKTTKDIQIIEEVAIVEQDDMRGKK